MPLLWNGPDGEAGNITPPHAFSSREGIISVLIYAVEKCILPYKGGRYALFECLTLKHTRFSKNLREDIMFSGVSFKNREHFIVNNSFFRRSRMIESP
jgi:hypothetical protein